MNNPMMKVDSEIREFVKTLNELGYETNTSCAGHAYITGKRTFPAVGGYVGFDKMPDANEVNEIAESFGLKDLTWRKLPMFPHYILSFNGIGQPKRRKTKRI